MTTRIVMIVVLLVLACAWTGAGWRDATPVHEVAIGRGPTAMVIDRRTERAFVLNSTDQTISVLDLRAGTSRRTTRVFPGTSRHGGYTNALAVDERHGRVFVGTYAQGQGGITTLDATSGQVLASARLPLFPRQIAVDEVTNRVFVSSAGVATTRRVSVLDATSGRALRTLTLDQGVGPLTVDERQGYILASGDRGLSVLDARSGARLRTISAGTVGGVAVNRRLGQAFLATTPVNGVGVSGGSIAVINLATGAVVRRIAGLYPQDMTIDEDLNRVYATSGEVMGAAPAGMVATIDATSGRLLHTATVGMDPGQVVASADSGRAFVVNGQDGTVSVLDARRGIVLRTVRLRAALTGTVVDMEGTLSHLVTIDEATNRVLIGNPSPYRIPQVHCPASCPAPIPILTGRGSLSMLDATTGVLRREITVGRAPLTMVADDSTGQVVVLNAGTLGAPTVKGSVSILSIGP